MWRQIDIKLAVIILIVLFGVASSYIIFDYFSITPPRISFLQFSLSPSFSKVKDVERFSSEEDFKNYLQSGEAESEYLSSDLVRMISPEGISLPAIGKGGGAPERVSGTTVQVPGIDEPDIVKTDGKNIYFSPSYIWRIWEENIAPVAERIISPEPKTKIKVVKAFPPADLTVESEIDKSGDLLLAEDILVVFSGDKIYGYDISNPKSPEKKWDINLEGNNSIVGARLYKNKVYLVSKQAINAYRPCPLTPLSINETPLTVKCQEIYHPVSPVPIDIAFHTMILDPVSGKIEKNISFVGSSGSSLVYMSEKAVYVTYSYYESFVKFFSNFLEKKCRDFVPAWVTEKVKRLEDYDISQQSKLLEFQIIMEKYMDSLNEDEKLRIENEFSNRLSDYYKEKRRDLEKTGIIKIGLEEFEIIASGNVPGYPINQFALDEYKGYLRIAITVGQGWRFFWGVGGESANDVYVLDENLSIQGSIKDLGLTERIYSVRFIEDKGYLVTFRETDPFYVLDLSQPQKPSLKGELKIPGYSSYLHPITEDKILGIGKEGWQVKISFFDVSSPQNPEELDKYILNEYWSDVLSTHHAFLLDEKHEIFFLPGGKGGYVFSFKNGGLKLEKAISDISAKRAVYINDYLYVIGDDKISVLNELNWERVKDLDLF